MSASATVQVNRHGRNLISSSSNCEVERIQRQFSLISNTNTTSAEPSEVQVILRRCQWVTTRALRTKHQQKNISQSNYGHHTHRQNFENVSHSPPAPVHRSPLDKLTLFRIAASVSCQLDAFTSLMKEQRVLMEQLSRWTRGEIPPQYRALLTGPHPMTPETYNVDHITVLRAKEIQGRMADINWMKKGRNNSAARFSCRRIGLRWGFPLMAGSWLAGRSVRWDWGNSALSLLLMGKCRGWRNRAR